MFPMSITLHTPAQLNAVLMALKPDLEAGDFKSPAAGAAYVEAGDFKSPAAGAAYVEAKERVAAHDQAEKSVKKDAAAQVEKPKSTAAATTEGGARGQHTVEAAAETAAPGKTAGASNPTAGNAAGEPQASTAAAEPVTYAKVAAAITAMVKKDRAKAVAALEQFGVAKGPELKPEQYADFLAALEV